VPLVRALIGTGPDFVRRTLLITAWYLGSFFVTYPGVSFLEGIFGSPNTSFNALLFLPHGVRIFAVWLFRHQAIIPLLVAHAIHVSIWGHWTPNHWIPVIAGTFSAYFAFEILRMARLNPFHVVTHDRAVWGRLVLAGILAAALNTILLQLMMMSYEGPHKELGRVLGYLIGDISGIVLFVIMLISIDAVRELRKDAPEDG
jgi:hypothetical protein